ncbi:MAG: aspartate-semialdehyde dehydrogenase [Saprospiraceae bacterium]|nr:aspartate-semialdehyde dehydrogenase [Bacteroidia bacterium]NNE14080.1 aspartate-semialdehyde dehydrogenase [Saprospiraceae bacterium]NNL92292.1 aspartate-semialdehyde dehydrogenase [Saprospiraceae bacterium]
MKIALVGATGLVGREMIEVLEERKISCDEFIPVASARSVGKEIKFNGETYIVHSMQDAIDKAPDFALFSAGGETSKTYAPLFADKGTTVIDNSSAWRMDPEVKLVVPEVNGDIITNEDRIIANPNCSTIQLVVALNPLHQAYGIKRLVISTYQSFTGTGANAVAQYEAEKKGQTNDNYPMAYHYPIFENCLPHCDVFLENDYTKEEMKLVHETRKIMNAPQMNITATAVRVPVHGGHSEAVNIEFEKQFDIDEVKSLLRKEKGLILQDDIDKNVYPMPRFARKKDEVFVGRVRRDESIDKGLNIWVVADNLRKGAATNAVQILQKLITD